MALLRQIANWCFLWDDAIAECASSIHAHSTEYAASPMENLLDAEPSTVAMFNATGSVSVEIDLGSAQTIYGFGIFNHNSNTKGVSNLVVGYSSDHTTYTTDISFDVATIVGDDDFVAYLTQGHNYQYWKITWQSVDAAGLYAGRIYLARSVYQLANVGPSVGAQKGYAKRLTVNETLGGVEHRIGRGDKRRILSGNIPADPGTDLVQIQAMVDQCEVNEKCFCVTDAAGTTIATSNGTRYGAGIHMRINADSWRYAIRMPNVNDIPIEAIEVL
jgi:hypothetical protein